MSDPIVPATGNPETKNPLKSLTLIALLTTVLSMFANKYLPEPLRGGFVEFIIESYQWAIGPGLVLLGRWKASQPLSVTKVNTNTLPTILATLILLGTGGVVGCQFFPTQAPVTEGSSAVVVNAERSVQYAFDSVNEFLKFEHEQRAFVKTYAPDVHGVAEQIRKTGPEKFRAARLAIAAYKASRSNADADTLEDKLESVETLAHRARQYLRQLNVTKSGIAGGSP